MASRLITLGLSLFFPFLSNAQTTLAPTYEALTNAAATGGDFRFSGPGMIVVPTPVSFGSATTLDANGYAVVLSGGGGSSILQLQTNTTLRLIGLSLIDGLARGSEQAGAVKPGQGGAIVNLGGDLTLHNCVLSNNVASGATNRMGGAVGGTGMLQVDRPAADAAGGAIWQVGGRLAIENSTFLTNRANSSMVSYAPAEGGAIYIKNAAALEISGTTFLNNSAVCGGTWQQAQENSPSKGGAIYVEATPARIDGGEISHNSAHGASGLSYGGAIYQAGAMLTISNAIVSHNGSYGGNIPSRFYRVGRSAFAGAIFSDGWFAMTRSAVLSNVCSSGTTTHWFTEPAPAYGGAISSIGHVQLENSTFSGNQSYRSVEGEGRVWTGPGDHGGALYSWGSAAVTNCTIVGHTASFSPLGAGPTNIITVKNTLFADNRYEEGNSIVDAGHNLSSDAEPQFSQSTSKNSVDPRLGPIGLYGGPTPVYPLMAGSPAINVADDSAAPATDQRGRARPYGAHADIGSFESSAPFFVWGKIQGYIDPSTTIAIGNTTNVIDADGNYFIGPLESGVYMATLTATNARFRPNPWLVPSDADRELSEVKSFELHAITFDPQLNDPAFVLAGNPGEVWEVELSPNFSSWTEYGPFTIPNTGLTNVPPPANAPFMFTRGSYTAPGP